MTFKIEEFKDETSQSELVKPPQKKEEEEEEEEEEENEPENEEGRKEEGEIGGEKEEGGEGEKAEKEEGKEGKEEKEEELKTDQNQPKPSEPKESESKENKENQEATIKQKDALTADNKLDANKNQFDVDTKNVDGEEMMIIKKVKTRIYKRHTKLEMPLYRSGDERVYNTSEPYGVLDIRVNCDKDKQDDYFSYKRLKLELDD